MTQRVIKFRIIYDNKINGYERLTPDGWEWMALDMNPEGRENWYRGVFPYGYDYKRNQYSGLTDKHGKEIYEHDIVRLANDPNQVQRKSIVSEICFLDGAFGACWRKTELWEGYNVSPSSVVFLNSIAPDQMEKIGDIYTTPELVDPKMIER